MFQILYKPSQSLDFTRQNTFLRIDRNITNPFIAVSLNETGPFGVLIATHVVLILTYAWKTIYSINYAANAISKTAYTAQIA